MNQKTQQGMAWWLAVGMAAVAVALTGCESDGNDETMEEIQAAATNAVGDAAGSLGDEDHGLSEFFYDGLHPTKTGNKIIARTFAKRIKPLADAGGNNINVIVCLGDSITDTGYPSDLSKLTGLTAYEEGVRGERSAGGAARIDGVLSGYKPAYICILYGANDVINHLPSSTVTGNLEAMVIAARANGTIPILATLTPMFGTRESYAEEARATSAAIRDLASRLGVALADLEKAF